MNHITTAWHFKGAMSRGNCCFKGHFCACVSLLSALFYPNPKCSCKVTKISNKFGDIALKLENIGLTFDQVSIHALYCHPLQQ